MKIFYLGPKNSYHYHVANKYFSQQEGCEYIPYVTFKDVFDAVKNDPQSHGVVALKNTLAGEIKENILRLEEMKEIIEHKDSTVLKIELNLIGLKNSSLNKIKTVYSHPKALAESSVFLNNQSIKGIPISSTSLGFDKIIEENNPSQAAIGHISLANHPEAIVLAKNIDNNLENYTTFAIIKKRSAQG